MNKKVIDMKHLDNMTISTPSKIRLNKFNGCPGKMRLLAFLAEEKLTRIINFYDLECLENWKNDETTLVVRLATTRTVRAALEVGRIATLFNADEFDLHKCGSYLFVRLWWD